MSRNTLILVLLLSIFYGSGGHSQFSEGIHGKSKSVHFEEDFCPISGPTESCGMATPVNRERTFIMVKPDGVQRGLVGEIIKRFEQKGFKLVALKFQLATEELLKKHYAAHLEQPFFPGLLKFILSGPVVPMVWEGMDVVKTSRQMLGATNPSSSSPGTIRGDFGILTGRNVIHGSDSVESATTEIGLWFNSDELVSWKSNEESWLYE